MDLNEIKEARKKAEAAVEDMTDVSLKEKAFEVILNKLLSVTQKEIVEYKQPSPTEKIINIPPNKNIIGKTGTESVLKLFQTEFGKTPKTLSEVDAALRERTLFYSKQLIQYALVQLVRNGMLRRLREKEIYKYVLA